MALTTESFTSVHATEVSGVQFGSLAPPGSRLILSSCCVLSVESSVTLPLESGGENALLLCCTFYIAALLVIPI